MTQENNKDKLDEIVDKWLSGLDKTYAVDSISGSEKELEDNSFDGLTYQLPEPLTSTSEEFLKYVNTQLETLKNTTLDDYKSIEGKAKLQEYVTKSVTEFCNQMESELAEEESKAYKTTEEAKKIEAGKLVYKTDSGYAADFRDSFDNYATNFFNIAGIPIDATKPSTVEKDLANNQSTEKLYDLFRAGKLSAHEAANLTNSIQQDIKELIRRYNQTNELDGLCVVDSLINLTNLLFYVFSTLHNSIHGDGVTKAVENLEHKFNAYNKSLGQIVDITNAQTVEINKLREELNGLKDKNEQLKQEKIVLEQSNAKLKTVLGNRKRRVDKEKPND